MNAPLELEPGRWPVVWRRFMRAIVAFTTSEVGGTATAALAILIVLLLGINALNVVNSYVGRDFMTAIERRDRAAFVRQALVYVGVFGLSTIVAVLLRFTEERLGVLWRGWLTGRLVGIYLGRQLYVRLGGTAGISNPDQRIAEDTRTFVTMTLSLLLLFLNGTLTVVAFSGVLWTISRPLFLVGIAYAAAGSLFTVLVGRRLVPLNYAQADREAELRSALVHVREHADAIALLHHEPQLESRLLTRVDACMDNVRRIVVVNRNLNFFTTGYNYMIQIIPALIIAPLFIRGDVEFGVITQSAMAFSHLLGAFSLIVTQFQAISSYATVLARLTVFAEAAEEPTGHEPSGIATTEDRDRVAFEGLTVRALHEDRVLVRDLTAVLPYGRRVLVHGPDGLAGVALVRTVAGFWTAATGRVVRPPLAEIAFLPERPYVPPGTLREALRAPGAPPPSDDEVHRALHAIGVDEVIARSGGLDVEREWASILSLSDQQLVSIARVVLTRPRFAFFEHPGRTLDESRVGALLDTLWARGITCVVVGGVGEPAEGYDARLELAGDGRWRWDAGPVRDAG